MELVEPSQRDWRIFGEFFRHLVVQIVCGTIYAF